MEHWLPVLWVALAIVVLLFLTIYVKLHSFVALLIVAVMVAFLESMPLDQLVAAITKGAGNTLAGVGLIVILGAALGQLMTDCGASKRVADVILKTCGVKYLKWGLLVIGSIFGTAMFFEVGFIIMMPLVIGIAREAKIPYMYLVIPSLAALAQAHSLLPPQPGPVALMTSLNADSGLVYIFGLITLIPSIIAAGIILPRFLKGLDTYKMPLMGNMDESNYDKLRVPNFGISLLIPLLPAILMVSHTVAAAFLPKESTVVYVLNFLGSPIISLFLALLVALYVFGIRAGRTFAEASNSISSAIKGISVVVMIIGAGGVFKEVIISAGVGEHIAAAVKDVNLNPLILAWLITAIIRWATGQGAVSAITAAGLVSPLLGVYDIEPVFLMLACAAGSNTITMPNDAAFWMMKETFNLSMAQTFKTWGLLELVNSVVGLGVVLLLTLFV
ncbi:MAG TPA: gluconate:H+ symporter [Candidatus Anaerobiospirillum pullistercoris]|uniref:Gluconate:H+ symporter n=1 Tax=Candidatus Anaerobiospirillum pullistercoris TaxID=2838452 RepID=A0A9D1WDF1_9GAMM|nr:gluconate:H+ symporter [Candidatus Anaerobiospirillum pullistercoris]